MAAVLMSAWLVACAAAWDRSTASGGPATGAAAARIAYEVASASRLSGRCRMLAERLADASIRARVAGMRPTGRRMRAAEAGAWDAWEAARCPERALPGIAFGVASAVNADEEGRRLGGLR